MIVETEGLTKLYGTHEALSHVDIGVHKGSVYGLVGPNGAGKPWRNGPVEARAAVRE